MVQPTYFHKVLGLCVKVLELGRELFEIDKRVGGHCWYEEKKEREKCGEEKQQLE